MRNRSSKRGYTAVEVLSAMMLLAIGAAGVIGMQKVVITGGIDARRYDIASNIANEWAAKLQRDGSFWTGPGELVFADNKSTTTKFLNDVTVAQCTGTNWCTPPGNAAVPPSSLDSFAYDAIGRPLGTFNGGNPDTFAHFCVQYRLNYLANPALAAGLDPPEGLIRAEIRVIFKRVEMGAMPNCNAIALDPSVFTSRQTYHYVTTTTVVRRHPLQ
jgi:prepilin-type N-terminal cleavage/methylation domain-containing protein